MLLQFLCENYCINYVSGQFTGFDHLCSHFYPDRGPYPESDYHLLTVVYPMYDYRSLNPDSGLHPDSGY